jgi:hypothetical protein
MIGYFKTRLTEQTSHLAIAIWVMLPLLMWDQLIPILHWPFGAAAILFLFPEAPAWAKLIGLPIPPQISTLIQGANATQPVDITAIHGPLQPGDQS